MPGRGFEKAGNDIQGIVQPGEYHGGQSFRSAKRQGKGVRFHTINRICYFLQCDVGDILKFDGNLEDEENEE